MTIFPDTFLLFSWVANTQSLSTNRNPARYWFHHIEGFSFFDHYNLPGYCLRTVIQCCFVLLNQCIVIQCCLVLLNQYWGIVTVPGFHQRQIHVVLDFCRNGTDDLGNDSPALWPTELVLHHLGLLCEARREKTKKVPNETTKFFFSRVIIKAIIIILSITPGCGPKVNPLVTVKPKLKSLVIFHSVECLGEL